MTKYLIKRILHGILSIVAVIALVMILIYSLMDRNLIFANDSIYSHLNNNSKLTYKYQKWEEYGYLDYVTYGEYLTELVNKGEISTDTRQSALSIARTESSDSKIVKQYVKQFTEEMQGKGYTVERKDVVLIGKKVADGGNQVLFAYKDVPVFQRLFKYFTGVLKFDNIHNAAEVKGDRGLTFTMKDPVYGGDKFAPAIIGNGTTHKYLLYFDGKFPYLHQNLCQIQLGTSYSVNKGVDVFNTMTDTQGAYVKSLVTYPTGLQEESADDLHTATYIQGSLEKSLIFKNYYTDDYTNTVTAKNGMSKIGYSFTIGIIATFMAYILGIPLGVVMARKKDGFIDKIGSLYIIFIIAVPSLAYIFLFKAIGGKLGLPTTFVMDSESKLMYILPIVSLALPSVANLMKWIRRYMIDQMNSDYVKFARSSGLTENEIFSNHILKNASIPIIHGIPGSILGALTGAIITERVYVVPGTGNLLTTAINRYDNGVIVGVTLFYALLSVTSIILGDILMSIIDPRISFTSKDR